jgi:hypothetical protein
MDDVYRLPPVPHGLANDLIGSQQSPVDPRRISAAVLLPVLGHGWERRCLTSWKSGERRGEAADWQRKDYERYNQASTSGDLPRRVRISSLDSIRIPRARVSTGALLGRRAPLGRPGGRLGYRQADQGGALPGTATMPRLGGCKSHPRARPCRWTGPFASFRLRRLGFRRLRRLGALVHALRASPYRRACLSKAICGTSAYLT